MSFVMQTVAGILRGGGGGSPMHPIEGGNATVNNGCSCHKHPSRCCHKVDSLAAGSSFSNSFECINDDFND